MSAEVPLRLRHIDVHPADSIGLRTRALQKGQALARRGLAIYENHSDLVTSITGQTLALGGIAGTYARIRGENSNDLSWPVVAEIVGSLAVTGVGMVLALHHDGLPPESTLSVQAGETATAAPGNKEDPKPISPQLPQSVNHDIDKQGALILTLNAQDTHRRPIYTPLITYKQAA